MVAKPKGALPVASLALATIALPLFAGCLGFGSAVSIGTQPQNHSVSVRTRTAGPHASNVVVVIMENRDYNLIIGSSEAPYINGTLVPEAALMTNSHA